MDRVGLHVSMPVPLHRVICSAMCIIAAEAGRCMNQHCSPFNSQCTFTRGRAMYNHHPSADSVYYDIVRVNA